MTYTSSPSNHLGLVKRNLKNNVLERASMCIRKPFLQIALGIVITFVSGCSPDLENLETASTQPTKIDKNVGSTLLPKNPIMESTATPISLPSPTGTVPPQEDVATVVPHESPVPTTSQPANEIPLWICELQPIKIDVAGNRNLRTITDLNFVGEETLIVEGWGDGISVDESNGITPTPSIDKPDPTSSSNVLFRFGQYDLQTNQASYYEPEIDLINNLCQEQCPYKVLSQSPDGNWQLVQVYHWYGDLVGIWVVSPQEKTRLLPFIPWSSYWEWVDDSSFLWFSFSKNDLGVGGYIVELVDEANVIRIPSDDPLYPTANVVAISPINNTILSTAGAFLVPAESYEEHYTEISIGNEWTTTSRTIPGISSVIWDDNSDSFMRIIVKNGAILFQDMEGVTHLRIPENQVSKMNPTDSLSDYDLKQHMSVTKFAISPSRDQLALAIGNDIDLFKCNVSSE